MSRRLSVRRLGEGWLHLDAVISFASQGEQSIALRVDRHVQGLRSPRRENGIARIRLVRDFLHG